MKLAEDRQFTIDDHDLEKRSIATGFTGQFVNGSKTDEVVVEYAPNNPRNKHTVDAVKAKIRKNLGLEFQREEGYEFCEK